MGALVRIAVALESIAASMKWRNSYLERLENTRRNRQETENAEKRIRRGVEMTGDQDIVGDERAEQLRTLRSADGRPKSGFAPQRPGERFDPRGDAGGALGRERRNETGGRRTREAFDDREADRFFGERRSPAMEDLDQPRDHRAGQPRRRPRNGE